MWNNRFKCTNALYRWVAGAGRTHLYIPKSSNANASNYAYYILYIDSTNVHTYIHRYSASDCWWTSCGVKMSHINLFRIFAGIAIAFWSFLPDYLFMRTARHTPLPQRCSTGSNGAMRLSLCCLLAHRLVCPLVSALFVRLSVYFVVLIGYWRPVCGHRRNMKGYMHSQLLGFLLLLFLTHCRLWLRLLWISVLFLFLFLFFILPAYNAARYTAIVLHNPAAHPASSRQSKRIY